MDPKERHGPCSPIAEMMPSTQNILEGDRLRVESLQARFKPKTKTNKYNSRFLQDDTKQVDITAYVAGDNCAVDISLGTPGQNLRLALDTNSDLTWIRCVHVDGGLVGMEFKANVSTSFLNFSCSSSECTQLLPEHTCGTFNNTANMCSQYIQHVDGSYEANGALSMDTLTITETGGEAFQNWSFVCATEVKDTLTDGGFGVIAGMLGLARNSIFVKQIINQIYGAMFSYCIPSDGSEIGFLKLGKRVYPDNTPFTPIITNSAFPSFYFIGITSISVSGVKLAIHTDTRAIIDTGVSFTRLPTSVYENMRNEFRNYMSRYGYGKLLQNSSVGDILDTCYDISSNQNIIFPTISFEFKGVALYLSDNASLYDKDSTRVKCLAFAGNSPNDWVSFGNNQLRKLEVVYDIQGNQLGFVPRGCK
ncbi:aspartic proteinase precursor [Castilleja foliolosa]|uniref:Aspartic proteinase n=1 Tax=Castilleja foliolosa TaxID=1961234 RepID=A0ABD3B8J4_9LAMI